MNVRKALTALTFCITAACTLAGCTEEIGNQPVPQAQAPQQAPARQDHPLAPAGQGAGSALGGAKRAATDLVDDAQQKSQEVADQADDINE